MGSPKIATCCYCGTRAALVLSGDNRHELACSSCGAPLHEIKMLPKKRSKAHREVIHSNAARSGSNPPKHSDGLWGKPKKPKKKKSLKRKGFTEIFDVIEDIFD